MWKQFAGMEEKSHGLRNEIRLEQLKNTKLGKVHSAQMTHQEEQIHILQEQIAQVNCHSNEQILHTPEAMKKCAARLLIKIMERKANVMIGRAFRRWSCNTSALQAVEEQMDMAEEMAQQLETTRETLVMLKTRFRSGDSKSHAQSNGLNAFSPSATSRSIVSSQQTYATRGLNTSFWTFSDDSEVSEDVSSGL